MIAGVKPCVCGEAEEIEVRAKKDPWLCFFVRCLKCGAESAKHREAEFAVNEWNRRSEEKPDGETVRELSDAEDVREDV